MLNTDLDKNRIQEIGKLHNEIIGHLKTSLEMAIRIGELLTEQKASLKHGEFIPWIVTNLPFTDRTARSYMRVYREKDRLKTETVSDLKSAYKLLAKPEINKDTMERLSDLWNLLNTDYFQATSVGLIKKREPTKAELTDYLYRIVEVDKFLEKIGYISNYK